MELLVIIIILSLIFDYILSDEKCDEIKECCPYYSLKRGKDLGRYNGRYRICRIMKAIDIIEYQQSDG